MEGDPRLNIFLSNTRKEVFHGVEHRHQIWRESPFDVEAVHASAREQFQQLLAQVTTPPGLDSGRVLLLLGESGSGKTNLVRAFRNHVHCNGLGLVGYMQMTTGIADYNRYVLSNLIDSLDQPYYETIGSISGLLRISNAIAGRCEDPEAIDALRQNANLEPDAVVEYVERAANRFIGQSVYSDCKQDLVRALLYLQRDDPGLKKRVIKYLRCEDLVERDRKLLCMMPRSHDAAAQRLIEQFGRILRVLNSQCLVLCVDQFEEMFLGEDFEAQFRRAMAALCAIADSVPSSVVVISCLEDYYQKLRARLTASVLDRLENDPGPERLVKERTAEEVVELIAQRLGYLYEVSGSSPSKEDPLYPIPHAFVQKLTRRRTRGVIDACGRFREECTKAGRIVDMAPPEEPKLAQLDSKENAAQKEMTDLERSWNDHVAQFKTELPETDAELAELFGWAVATCAEELESGHRFDAHIRGGSIEVRVLAPTKTGKHRLAAEVFVTLCNRAPQGGGLSAQIEQAEKQAGKRTLALIRSNEFPKDNRPTAIAKKLAEHLKNGGRRAVVEDSDWRTLAAFREFRKAHERRPYFKEWMAAENHLSRLLPMIRVLDLDHLEDAGPSADPSDGSNPLLASGAQGVGDAAPATSVHDAGASAKMAQGGGSAVEASGPLLVGVTGDLVASPISLDPDTLRAHAAFLGGSGSGKTTLALNVIEQLALRDIPAILVDRKGDLCGYARDGLWEKPHPEPALNARRSALRERLDVAFFTPGHPEGRPLAISLVPDGLETLPEFERELATNHAAYAIGGMLDYKDTGKHKSLRAVLSQAIQLLVEHGDPAKLDLESLIHFIDSADQMLVNALGRLDTKLLKTLVQDLETLRLSARDLLAASGERLDAELLLGLGRHARPGRTRLSIVSTKFLGDNASILFWVSQLLLALTRWVTRAPSQHLQAVVLFDEADVYLPAQAQPPTKAPMENLLRRARSGGLGILLATQSPGDLDYKCRDNIRSWFVGRVTQQVAIDKMKPLLSAARTNVAERIPAQTPGEFHLLQDGHTTAFRANLSFLKTEQVPEGEMLALARRTVPSR